jgi:ribosomal protein S18 acetylase RimI-like enzyme
MEPVAFTPAGPDDTAALLDLFCRVRGHDLGAAAWPEAIRDVTLRIQFEAQRRGYAERWPSATTEFLTHGGVRAGWVTVDRAAPSIHVVDIAVVPERRGQGIGMAALRALLDEGERDARRVTLSVSRSNLSAMRLYSRLGFQPTGGNDLDLHLEWRPAAPAAAVPAPALSAQLFRGALDTWFEVVQDGSPLMLPLKEVNEHAASGGFARFSLIFHGPGDRLLPQGLYTVRHPAVGEHDLFVVPVIGSTRERIVYEVCFAVPLPRQMP